jgi:hypothetical protein
VKVIMRQSLPEVWLPQCITVVSGLYQVRLRGKRIGVELSFPQATVRREVAARGILPSVPETH